MIEEQGKKINRCYYKSKQKFEALINKDDHKSDYKKILLKKIVKEKPGKIEELTSEIDHDDLMYFENNTASKDCTNFENM